MCGGLCTACKLLLPLGCIYVPADASYCTVDSTAYEHWTTDRSLDLLFLSRRSAIEIPRVESRSRLHEGRPMDGVVKYRRLSLEEGYRLGEG